MALGHQTGAEPHVLGQGVLRPWPHSWASCPEGACEWTGDVLFLDESL